MNNTDFRKLLSSTPAHQENDASTPSSRSAALGARKSAFASMTPRPGKAPSSDDFARQVREQHAKFKPTKKFKSVAPKGSKFAAGYIDRAKARQEAEDEEDDKAKRIKALEEQVKLGQLPAETFEALRDEILGGDASNTHLVKGLDRKLLERVRRGEDVLGLGRKDGEEDTSALDLDEELDELGGQEVEAVKKEKAEKKGIMAPPPIAGKKRTRDEIMAELKAQRQAAAHAKAESARTFDSRWRKVGEQAKPKIEIDHKGREVVSIVKQDGTVKKMIRKAQESGATAEMPDITKPILGADIPLPDVKKIDDEEDDEDIFAGAGTEYNPLGEEDGESDSDDEGQEPAQREIPNADREPETAPPRQSADAEHTSERTSASQESPKAPRNYFGKNTATVEEAPENRFKGVESVLKKAAKLGTDRAGAEDEDEDDDGSAGSKEEREARLAKRAKMLAQQDRDMDDIDMGFGGSRGEDEADLEDSKVKLSQWKGTAGGDDEDGDEGGKTRGDKKKRKPKKRKGDANNMADIMRVIEGRKGGASK